MLHQRVLFGGQTVIHANEVAITAVAWRQNLIAWMNDRGRKAEQWRNSGGVGRRERQKSWSCDQTLQLIATGAKRLRMDWDIYIWDVTVGCLLFNNLEQRRRQQGYSFAEQKK